MLEKFTIVKKGYCTEEVHKHIGDLEAKIEEHVKKESAISGAIVSAEMTAKQIINNAAIKADEIVSDAKKEVVDIIKMIDQEKKSLAEFCEVYDYIVKKYFTTNAHEMTAPLREKLAALSQIGDEMANNGVDLVHVEESQPNGTADGQQQSKEETASTVEGFF